MNSFVLKMNILISRKHSFIDKVLLKQHLVVHSFIHSLYLLISEIHETEQKYLLRTEIKIIIIMEERRLKIIRFQANITIILVHGYVIELTAQSLEVCIRMYMCVH